MNYPETRYEPLLENLHGAEVSDPYRWLEEGDAPEVRAWTEAQNRLTRETLGAFSGREAVRERLEELLQVGMVTPPWVRRVPHGWRYFYQKREGSQDQPLLYWRDGLDGEERVLIDPAVYEADAAAALDWWYPSVDGALVAYGISRQGDEKSVLGIRRVETGEDLPDRIPHTRYSSLAWLPDGSGFYYSRYPEPGSVPPGEENYWKKLYFHPLGGDWREDREVFGAGRAREDMLGAQLSPNGRWLCVEVHQGWAKNEVYLLDRRNEARGFVPVVEGVDARFAVEVQNDRFYLRTNWEASNYRLFAVDPEQPGREHWREILPEGPDVMEAHALVGGRLVCEYLRNASAALKVYTPEGELVREVALPGIGSLTGWGGHPEGEELFFGFVSFTTPPAVYRHLLPTGETNLWQRADAPIDPERYEVRQVRFPSRDGTQVSMFLIHRKGLQRDGDRPALLYGYGGFNASMTPVFSRGAFLMADNDGVYAYANLRGGGEYGEAWHQAGMKANKQNVFDDCIAAAEYLVREGWTRPERLALQGGSNGGLLVGAVVAQRPDLFRAAVCQVPLLDMVRYHLFSIARLWIPEYGSSEDPDGFRVLHAYSPYHNLREGEHYPAMLLTAAESDTRVDPLHARKFGAMLQRVNGADTPILLRIEGRAGHGAGKPLSKVLEEGVDTWSFLFQQLGIGAPG